MGAGGAVACHRGELRALPRERWDDYLLRRSGLPGPRANLELAQAVADEGDEPLFRRFAALTPAAAPFGSPLEFLALCGVIGLGRLVAEGRTDLLEELRRHASDPRWRVREAVAMALQRVGDAGMSRLLDEMERWSGGSFLEQRAAAAALCEPRLLHHHETVRRVVGILDRITGSLAAAPDRRDPAFRVLLQGLAYCWSVAVAAAPAIGMPVMERWLTSDDPDVRWAMRENLKKDRLRRADPDRVAGWRARIDG